MKTNPFTRREFLKRTAAASSLVALACESGPTPQLPGEPHANPYGTEDAAACAATPPNIEGPYYRRDAPARTNLNIFNEPGYILRVQGRVLAPECAIDSGIANATVDVWQANAYGQYDNTSADFNFRGVLASNALGEFAFDTIYPGAYDLGTGQYRPATST